MNRFTDIITLPLGQPVAIFMVVLVIILFTPLLLNRFKIPHIVGMIIAGMVIGPYGFNILERDASFRIFGEVGILYLMFLAGVEIDMYNLKLNSRRGLIFGLITFSVPMLAGLVASRWLLGTGWLTAVLIASMYASHTLISYPIINRFGLSNSRPAVISICSTIVAVLLALIVLAEVVSVKASGSVAWSSTFILLIETAIYGLVLGLLIPRLTRVFFKNFNDNITQYIFVLAVMLFASLLAKLIGLEAILGAFFAGLILNRFIPSRSSLMSRIEFVGNAIFIPYFLIGVGMLINVRAILNGPATLWVAAVMTTAALGSKWIAAFTAQVSFGMSALERRIMFGLTSGKAAATIAATMVGFQYGLLSEELMNGAVLMILGCCAVASIATERASIKLRMDMTSAEMQKEIASKHDVARQLVAVANPVTAEGLMKLAVFMRSPKNRHAITALFVRNNDDPNRVSIGRNSLNMAVKAASALDLKVEEVERYDINIVTGLINVAKERSSTDIIIGLHRRTNIVDSFFGVMTEQLLKSTNRMVIMSRCFIPVNTITRIVVVVPRKAEYETGFGTWVNRIGNLGSQLGCRVIFIAHPDSIPYIQGALTADNFRIRHEFREMSEWDDFIMLSNHILDDDLLVIVGARRTSISFSADFENLPAFLNRYFSRHNVMILYPEQFGTDVDMPTPIDTLQQNVASSPSRGVIFISALRDAFAERRKRKKQKGRDFDL